MSIPMRKFRNDINIIIFHYFALYGNKCCTHVLIDGRVDISLSYWMANVSNFLSVY